MHAFKGQPTLGLDFEQYANGELSMWTHIDHAMPYEEVRKFFVKCYEHLGSFINNAAMCPYNPQYNDLRKPSTEEERR